MPAVELGVLQAAFAVYCRVKDTCSKTQNWAPYADLFTEDCLVIEHAYGEFRGREAVRKYIVDVMAPYANMTFPQEWVTFDPTNGAVIFLVRNAFPPPLQASGEPFFIPNVTRLVYGHDGLWSEEQDWYNPARDAPRVVRAWRAAGGTFQAAEAIKMKHRL